MVNLQPSTLFNSQLPSTLNLFNPSTTTKMHVEIITPDKSLFKGEATSVTVPGVDGSLGFLNNHAPLITVLKAGDVKLKTANGSEVFPVKGGVVEVSNNTVIVLAE